jgi:TPR repeat protein
LGWCYQYVKGVVKNLETAFEWNTKAADQGEANAQHNLGVCYEEGQVVTKNLKTAVEWYTKAAEQGHACAQFQLESLL